jgi:glycosyltransferase involved in cell wall biosynthesis
MPTVTVAIPAYKAQYLSQAIASALAQTIADFELLISDDCADGSAREVIARFADPRIRVIEGPRKGLVANSVHLWENARCDLFKFLYDDDFLLPFCLADLISALQAHPEANYAFCARHLVDAAGVIYRSPQNILGGETALFPGQVTAEAVIGRINNPVGEPTSILIRRSAFANGGCLSQYCGVAIRHHIDLAFFLNAAALGPCIGIPAFGAAFRRHEAQVTSSRQASDFSYGVAEWELFIRGAVARGQASPEVALRSFDRLEILYANHASQFPELRPLLAELPALRTALFEGARDVLDQAFLARLADVERAIAARRSVA